MTFYYLPLLETESGSAFVNTGTPFVVDVDTYDGLTPTPAQILASGALQISSVSDPMFQGALAVGYNTYLDGPHYAITYNGSQWGAKTTTVTPAEFQVTLSFRELAWAALVGPAFKADLFPITTPTNPTPSNGPDYLYSGGSQVTIHVIPLIWPVVSSITPTSIPADNTFHDVTFTLQRALNPKHQSPVVTVTGAGITVDPAGVRSIKDVYGSVTGWVVGMKTPPQLAASVDLHMDASESLEYLHSATNNISTSTVGYMINTLVGTLGISGATKPLSASSIIMTAPSASGWVETASGVTNYAGEVQIEVRASSATNNFKDASVVVQQEGTSARTTLGQLEISGAPYTGVTSSGNIVYYQDYTMIVDSGLLMNRYASYNVGIVANSLDLKSSTTWSNDSFVNCNLSKQFSAYGLHINMPSGPTGLETWDSVGIPTAANGWQTNQTLHTSYPALTMPFGMYVNPPTNLEGVSKGEMYMSGPGMTEVLVSSSTTVTPNGLEFAIPQTTWAQTPTSMRVKFFSKATAYGTGYVFTPPQAIQFATTGGGGSCFGAGTYVLTVDGPKPISELVIGSHILTISEATFTSGAAPELVTARVARTLTHCGGDFATFNLNGVITTPEHPWAVDDYSFVDAGLVEQRIMSVDLTDASLTPVAAIRLAGPRLDVVHNLTIADANTFLVAPGKFGPWFLVHNKEIQTPWEQA